MSEIEKLCASLDGELFSPDSPGYEAARRPRNLAFDDVYPSFVVRCRSEADVVRAISYATATGTRLVPRGGGHCFAGRSSTEGVVVDLSQIADTSVTADGSAVIGAGASLGSVYRALHSAGQSLPAGCGDSVGIAGLTLGGGIGLLGRMYGLTSDRLLSARVVLADGAVVECDRERDPELFWGLRGAGGGQFGIVTSLRFDTVPEPMALWIDAELIHVEIAALVKGWQSWAPKAPDEVTLNLAIERGPEGGSTYVRLFGASFVSESETRTIVEEFATAIGSAAIPQVSAPVPYHTLKAALSDRERSSAERPVRIRSEFFARTMSDRTIASVLTKLASPGNQGMRRLAFTAMGGAYNRVAENATAFAHRGESFLLEHVTDQDDFWLDASWTAAHADGSGRVYPNFPDGALVDPTAAYHAGNAPGLAAIKRKYDPRGFFDFPQAVRPARIVPTDHHTKEV